MGPLEAFMHVEAAMDLARKSLGNSTTARQLAEAGLAGGVGYGLTTGDWSPRDLSLAALLSGGAHRAGMRINSKVVQAVAKKLVSNNPAVYQSGVQAVALNATLMKALRSAIAVPIAGTTHAYRQQGVQP